MTMCTNLTAVELFPTHPVGATEKKSSRIPRVQRLHRPLQFRPVTDPDLYTDASPPATVLHDRCGHQTIPEGLNFRPLPY